MAEVEAERCERVLDPHTKFRATQIQPGSRRGDVDRFALGTSSQRVPAPDLKVETKHQPSTVRRQALKARGIDRAVQLSGAVRSQL
jgi:hypothetical protein